MWNVIIAGITGGVAATVITFLIQKFVYKNPEIYGNVADWFGAFGTVGAVIVSLAFGYKANKKYIDLQFSSVEIHHKNTKEQNQFELNFKFNVYNAGNKPFLLEKIILKRKSSPDIVNSCDMILINPGEMKMFDSQFKMPGKSWSQSNLDKYMMQGNNLYIELVESGKNIFKIPISSSGVKYHPNSGS